MTDSIVNLVGNLTSEPSLRYTPGGMPVCELGLAVNHRFQRNGQWEEKTSFFDITVFGNMGENVSESLGKGCRVMVTGRLEQDSWEKDGERRSKVKVIADEVGPSLRWATCDVTKIATERNGPEPRPATKTPTPKAQAPAYDYDEEVGF